MIPSFFLITSCLILSPPQEPKFRAQVLDTTVSIGYGMAIGDVDGDGKPDVLLADKKQFVWYRNGDWKRFVMVENLTESDNVCIAARDLDGDGRVEVAVGAQWNPSETSDTLRSGSVHYLIRPADPTGRWTPVELHHEPTIHRMRWIVAEKKAYLLVVPLHGRGNKGGEGVGVKVIAYELPTDPRGRWKYSVIDESMHMTHNLDVVQNGKRESVYVGGKEGVKRLVFENGKWVSATAPGWVVQGQSFGEIRIGKTFAAAIEPMHGNQLTVYDLDVLQQAGTHRVILTNELNQGHALAVATLLKGGDQIVVGWREPNREKKTGIKIFVRDAAGGKWTDFWLDENGIACEDLQVADLNGDGKKDVIAAGRATGNLKVYWNLNP